jgi:hypothetical protein
MELIIKTRQNLGFKDGICENDDVTFNPTRLLI